jgi:predicted secreted Zn-dependent protease
VEPTIAYKYYPVTPEVGRSLHRQLLADTPLRHEGRKAYGLTNSPIKASYRISPTTIGLCRIRNLTVSCHCDISLPQLQSTDPGLKSDFEAYLALLKDHEMTHCRISAAYAGRLKKDVLALGELPCQAIKGDVDALSQRMEAELVREQKRFDDNTHMGGYQARSAQIMLDRPKTSSLSAADGEGLANLPEADPDAFWTGPADGEPETGTIYKGPDGVWRNY